MPDYSRDEDFQREWERQFVRSVRAATASAYARAARQPPEAVYTVLARELRRRGIHPVPDAVLAAATLISRGEPPPILRTGPEHHARLDSVPQQQEPVADRGTSEHGDRR